MENTKRSEILNHALKLVHGERQSDYGPPDASFQRIANQWNESLMRRDGKPLTPYDVCMAMVGLKRARLENGFHYDSILDAICYLALAYELFADEKDL